VDARVRASTVYGVTNERIIMLSGLFTRQTKSVWLRAMSEISLKERADGSGTIVLGPQNPMSGRMPAGWPGASRYLTPSLDQIDQVKEVYGIIQRARRGVR
jgi:hypothetical protein